MLKSYFYLNIVLAGWESPVSLKVNSKRLVMDLKDSHLFKGRHLAYWATVNHYIRSDLYCLGTDKSQRCPKCCHINGRTPNTSGWEGNKVRTGRSRKNRDQFLKKKVNIY